MDWDFFFSNLLKAIIHPLNISFNYANGSFCFF